MPKTEYPAELIRAATLNVGDMRNHLLYRASNLARLLEGMHFGVFGMQEVTGEHVAAIEPVLPNHKNHFDYAYGHQDSGLTTVVNQKIFPHSESHRPNGRLADSQVLVTELISLGGQEWVFVNRHLAQEVYKEGQRLLQTFWLAKYLQSNFPNKPVIIAGDTNSTKAAPLNLLTPLLGYKSAYKEVHGREPDRTYPSRYGEALLDGGLDGEPWELFASRALRWGGNALRAAGVLKGEVRDSRYAGCDVDRILFNPFVVVRQARIIADDSRHDFGPIGDHFGEEVEVEAQQPANSNAYLF